MWRKKADRRTLNEPYSLAPKLTFKIFKNKNVLHAFTILCSRWVRQFWCNNRDGILVDSVHSRRGSRAGGADSLPLKSVLGRFQQGLWWGVLILVRDVFLPEIISISRVAEMLWAYLIGRCDQRCKLTTSEYFLCITLYRRTKPCERNDLISVDGFLYFLENRNEPTPSPPKSVKAYWIGLRNPTTITTPTKQAFIREMLENQIVSRSSVTQALDSIRMTMWMVRLCAGHFVCEAARECGSSVRQLLYAKVLVTR